MLMDRDDLCRITDKTVCQFGNMNQPILLVPTSTKQPKFVMLVTIPGSTCPSFRSSIVFTVGSKENTWMVWRGSRPGLSSSSIISNKVGIPTLSRDVFLQVELFLQFFIADQFGDSTFQVLCHQFDDRITFRMDGRVVHGFLPSW